MIDRILTILFYILWIPSCLILVLAIMLWAILLTGYNYIINVIKKLWKIIINK
jgi:hypothetical protein